MPRRRLIPLALALAIGATGSAQAQQGVFVDPDSPSGKEYAIPLETARRQADPKAAGTERVAPGRRDESPLFGEGIEPGDGDAAAGSGSAGGRGGSSGRPSSDKAAAPVRRVPPATVRAAVSRPGPPDGGVGTALTVGGGAALVLLAGGLAGLAMRRSRGRTS